MGIADKFDALVPTSMNDLIALADRVSKSTIIPVAYRGKPADCLVAMSLGLEVGLKPMAALQSICVINGNPGIFGTAARALVMATGQLQSIMETDPTDVEKTGRARCEIIRKGYSEPFVGEWSLEKVRKAGLAGKDNHQKYPSTMLAWRAFHDAARKAFPDVYKGLAVAEELQELSPSVWGRKEDDTTVTLSLDAPAQGGDDIDAKIGVSDATAAPVNAGAAVSPRRGRPPRMLSRQPQNQEPQCTCVPKPRFDVGDMHLRNCPRYQEPQAPSKPAVVTPLSPAGAAPTPSTQPEPSGTCQFCHEGIHSFNDCPQNRSAAETVTDEGGDAHPRSEPEHNATAAPAPAGAAASNGRTLNDEEQAEIERMSKLLRPKNHLSWLLRQLEPFGIEDVADLPADKMKDLIKRMQENA